MHLYSPGDLAVRTERLEARARGRVLRLDKHVLRNAGGESGGYDTVVSVHALCGVDDIDAAIRRIDELLAADGQVLLLEHVQGRGGWRHAQDGWAALSRRCRPNRDVVAALRRNGFAVTDCDRFSMRTPLPMVAPHISAVAIRKVRPSVEDKSE
jgi:hypothetical protein